MPSNTFFFMTQEKVILAYHQLNENTAKTINDDLTPAGFEFEHLMLHDAGPYLHEQIRQETRPICLLISDNFLRSTACMYELLPTFQDLVQYSRVKSVIIAGVVIDEETGEQTIVPTSFDRVSNIIQYMNFWQDQYLEARRQKRQVSVVEETALNDLKVIRSISSEIGEFLRFLRNRDCISLEELQDNNYLAFFKFVHRLDLHAKFEVSPVVQEEVLAGAIEDNISAQQEEAITAEAVEEFDFSSIPGIDLLSDENNPVQEDTTISSTENTLNTEIATQETVASNALPVVEEPIEVAPPPPSAMEYMEAAQEQLPTDPVSGLTTLNEAVLQYPKDSALRFYYAQSLVQYQDNISEARKQLHLLMEQDADSLGALQLAAELAEVDEDFEQARVYYEQLILKRSDEAAPHYRLANILANKFDDAQHQASELFLKAIEIDPTLTDAHYQYGALQDEFFDNPTKAEQHYNTTIELESDHPFVYYDLALLYHRTGRTAAATMAYKKAIQLNPDLQSPDYDNLFLTPEIVADPEPLVMEQAIEEVADNTTSEHSNELIASLQADIKRLEELLIQNSSLLKSAQETTQTVKAEAEQPTVEEKPPHKRVNKVVLITGATAGIGRATANRFAAEGYRLILTGRRTERLKQLKATYEAEHESEVLLLPFDVRDQLAVEEVINGLPEAWKDIDYLINNAGLALGLDFIQEGSIEDWETMIDTNVKGLLYMTRAISPNMVARKKGHIINVCSSAGKEVYQRGAVYCATKHAVDALTRAMRLDLHVHNVKVSQVAPAHVEETEFARVRFHGDAERANIYDDFNPLKSSDVADAIFYIATRPDYVTIQDVVLAGTQQASATTVNRSGRQ